MGNKNLIVIFLILFKSSLNAQISKRYWMMVGSVEISSVKSHQNGNSTTTLFSITPKVGYFFIDKLAAGLSVNTNFYRYHYENEITNTSSTNRQVIYEFGPFVRYYFLSPEKMFNILLEVQDQYGFSEIKNNSQPATRGNSFNSFGFLTGPIVFLNSSVAIEWTCGYSWLKEIGSSTNNLGTNNFITSVGFQIHLKRDRNN